MPDIGETTMTATFKYTNEVKKLPIDAKVINREINSVAKSANALAPRIHAALFAAAAHSVEHKDGSLVTNLWNALGNSVNKKNGIAQWLNKYTSLRLTTDKAGAAKWLGKNKEYSLVPEAEFIAFYDMPEVEKLNSKPFDIIASLLSLVKRAETAYEKGEIKGAKPKALFNAVEKLAEEYKPKEETPKAIVSTPKPVRKQGTRPANSNVKAEPVAA